MSYAIYLLYRTVIGLLSLLPLRENFLLGRMLGLIAWMLVVPYRRIALQNLRIAFSGEKSDRQLKELTREHFMTLGANLFSSIKIASMSPQQIDARVTFQNLKTLTDAIRSDEGVVMVISHIGNWELFAQLGHHAPGSKFGTIYQSLRNPHVDRHVKKTRARFGVVPFDRKDGFNAPIRFLREGGLVGVLVDQHAGDSGVWAPLFGRLASTSPLAATLASRTNSTLIPVAIYTTGIARWRVVVSPPIPRADATPEQMTARINQVLEGQVRESPADWFWVHERWKTPEPRFLLSGYKRGVTLPDGFGVKQLKPFRILVRSGNWLGDAVMSAPAVRAIKRGRIDAHVSVLTRAKLADFWKTVSEVDEVISIEPGEGLLRVVRKLRRDFEIAILFPNSLRSALEAWLAGIPRRIGYRGHRRSWLLNQGVPGDGVPRRPQHQVHDYIELATSLGAQVDPELVPGKPPTSGILKLGLCPGAEYGPAKRWLPERFAEVAKAISGRYACHWFLFGVESDREIVGQISAVLGEWCIDLVGKTTLTELADKLRECRLLLTNDTGTMHLAAHLGVPVVAIFGSTEPALTGPLGRQSRVVRHHVPCSPCFLRECPLDFRCMNSVSADEVIAAVVEELGR